MVLNILIAAIYYRNLMQLIIMQKVFIYKKRNILHKIWKRIQNTLCVYKILFTQLNTKREITKELYIQIYILLYIN